jgi:hypothetical protein
MVVVTEVQQRLVGTWRLVRWEEHDPDGTVSYPLGKDAVGQIMYDAEGRMSAQLMQRDQMPFGSDDWRQASADEKANAWSNYFGYFGTYSIDEQAKKVTHHIEGSWFPNLVGQDQERITGSRENNSCSMQRRRGGRFESFGRKHERAKIHG